MPAEKKTSMVTMQMSGSPSTSRRFHTTGGGDWRFSPVRFSCLYGEMRSIPKQTHGLGNRSSIRPTCQETQAKANPHVQKRKVKAVPHVRKQKPKPFHVLGNRSQRLKAVPHVRNTLKPYSLFRKQKSNPAHVLGNRIQTQPTCQETEFKPSPRVRKQNSNPAYVLRNRIQTQLTCQETDFKPTHV